MDLATLVRDAHSRGNSISGTFSTSISIAEINKSGKEPYLLTLRIADQRITFRIPRTKNLGENDERSVFRKVLVMKSISEREILLHWAPAEQPAERGFDVTLSFTEPCQGSFMLCLRLPDTFPLWEKQLQTARGVEPPDSAA